MSLEARSVSRSAWREAREQIEKAVAAKKCWPCGCLHGSLDAIERTFPNGALPGELIAAMRAARDRLQTSRYDCLGCSECFPALAVNALNEAGAEIADGCPTEANPPREGWPPLPGDYTVLRFRAPVAVCTVTSADLARSIAREAVSAVSLVGTLQTENLGIERVIQNLIANPNVRFLVLCGADSRRSVGHLPGRSLLALAQAGLDEGLRIKGAPGKRPVLRNVPRAAVEHFRRTVEVVDRIGDDDPTSVLEAVRRCGLRDPGPAEPFPGAGGPALVPGNLPERMTPDPAGYLVVYVDRPRARLALEHYRNDGTLNLVIEGRAAAELYTPAIERGLVTRLDHAAYLGRELARAEAALAGGDPFVQDGAPEKGPRPSPDAACGCGTSCSDRRST